MASDLENSIKNAAAKLAKALEDATDITVETWYVEVGPGAPADQGDGRLAAKTVIELDGDSKTTIPMNAGGAGGFTINTELQDLHQKNVTTAVEYRARVLDSLLGLIQRS
jgi:hypothetical protein